MRREHLLIYLGLAWAGGISLSRYAPQPGWAWLALGAASLAALFVVRRIGRPWGGPVLCALALCLGAARYQAAQPRWGDPAFVATYNDSGQVTLHGIVADEPEVRDQDIRLRLRVDRLVPAAGGAARGVGGLVLVYLPRFPVYGYGDELQVSGMLETPPVLEDFSYRDYLARQGIHSLLRFGQAELIAERACARTATAACNPALQTLFDFKAQALQRLALLFPEPQASLLAGILLGVDSGIPPGLQEAFSATGTTHILAISGFNVSIVAAAFVFLSARLFGQFARGRAAFAAIAGIGLYALLAGANAPVVRAAIMGGLAGLARLFGRQSFGPASLFAAGIAMTALNPLTLWDVGFQLSFTATLGLILYAGPVTAALVRLLRPFTAWAEKREAARHIGEYLGLTLAAQIATLPLIAFYFRRLSLISLLANVLILPAQPPVMILGGLALLAGLIWLPLGAALGWLAWPFATYTIAAVEWLARVPGASVSTGRFSLAVVAGLFGALGAVTWLASRPPGDRPGWLGRLWAARASNMFLAGLALGAVLVWSAALTRPDGRLHVTFLDVGAGEAALVQTPSGEFVLLGGGPSPVKLGEGLGRRLPFWGRRLALVVVPGPGDSQATALAAELPRYAIRQALVAGPAGRSAAYRELMLGLNARSVPVIEAEAGREFDLGDGARLRVLWAGEAGIVARLAWGDAAFLLPLGESAGGLKALNEAGQLAASTALLVPEQGARGALDRQIVEAIHPWAAVLSVGEAGPAAETLAALEGYAVLRTDRTGWIQITTDGEQMWAEVER